MLEGAPDAICASPYGLSSDRVRTPSTVNDLPGSRPLERPDDLRVARIVERCELLRRQTPELHIRFPRPCNGTGDEPLARDVRKDAPADARSFSTTLASPIGPGYRAAGRRGARAKISQTRQNAEYRAS